jgi:hypothetical protein
MINAMKNLFKNESQGSMPNDEKEGNSPIPKNLNGKGSAPSSMNQNIEHNIAQNERRNLNPDQEKRPGNTNPDRSRNQ